MATQTSALVGGDVMQHEGNPGITRDEKTITNASGAEMVLEAGYPMDDNVPELDGGEAGVDGLLLQGITIPDGESAKVAVLARGPASVNQDAIPTADYAGDDFTIATIVTALEAIGIVVRSEPDTVATQTT